MTINDFVKEPEDIQYNDRFGEGFESQKDYEESMGLHDPHHKCDSTCQNSKDCPNADFNMRKYCLRHQHSYKGEVCDQCGH